MEVVAAILSKERIGCGLPLEELHNGNDLICFEVLLMPLSGEAIRLMNYIDDVSVTLRRVVALSANLPAEERQLVSDHLKSAKPSLSDVLNVLEAK